MKSGVGIAPPEHFCSTAVATSTPIVPPCSTRQRWSNIITAKKSAAIPDQDNTRSDTDDEDGDDNDKGDTDDNDNRDGDNNRDRDNNDNGDNNKNGNDNDDANNSQIDKIDNDDSSKQNDSNPTTSASRLAATPIHDRGGELPTPSRDCVPLKIHTKL